jgi:hypothetical protein
MGSDRDDSVTEDHQAVTQGWDAAQSREVSRTKHKRGVTTMRLFRIATMPATIVTLLALAQPVSATSVDNSGFYDHQIIEYQATAEVTSSPRAAQLISKGNVVYHIVGATGTTPAVQCARLLAALPNDATSCNVLNFIPTEVGYAGGAWNLQIFHWNPGITPVELSKDDDILAAVAAGKGTLEVTAILVRCPVINFAALR